MKAVLIPPWPCVAWTSRVTRLASPCAIRWSTSSRPATCCLTTWTMATFGQAIRWERPLAPWRGSGLRKAR